MSTSTMHENVRKRKRSSNSDVSPKTKLRQVTDETHTNSETEETQNLSSDDDLDAEEIHWDSDDLDELEDNDGQEPLSENTREQAEPTTSDSQPNKNKKLKPLSKHKVDQSREAISKTGVIYLSRIPPGLNPTKIRQLLSIFSSPVLRIFLAPESQAVYLRRTKSGDSKKRQFTEGWVEFADKKVAKKVVTMLNAERVGQRKGDKWFDDLWCMKYLPKFKWHHLTEQIGPPLSPCAACNPEFPCFACWPCPRLGWDGTDL